MPLDMQVAVVERPIANFRIIKSGSLTTSRNDIPISCRVLVDPPHFLEKDRRSYRLNEAVGFLLMSSEFQTISMSLQRQSLSATKKDKYPLWMRT